jgi:DNA-binding CsgD family transcriptional regulator
VALILGIGYVLRKYPDVKALTVVKYYFILLNFLFTLLGSFYFLLGRKRQGGLRYPDLKSLSVGLLSMMVLQNIVLLFYDRSIYLALIFTFIYFVNGGFMPIYIRYKSDLSKLLPENEMSESFEQFCKTFEISPRETEIVNEICKGLSNQQIADRLFISLQTVKDHTHRIYSKTNCTSRSQLIRMVNETLLGKQ